MTMFDDPRIREVALTRIELLRQLADDLTDIVEGNAPTAEQLAEAVVITGFEVTQRDVPCLRGFVRNHPILKSKLITTSQLFHVDPTGRWARTLSRFYRLEEPLS